MAPQTYKTVFNAQDAILEQWYWHTLYFSSWIEASKAQEKINPALDQCCDLNPEPSANNRYAVTFSTNYPFEARHQQNLIALIGSHVDFETVFNQPGEEAEDLFKGFRWSEPEKSDGVTPKSRIHIAHNLCTLCGTRPRASYGLWCIACKRAARKPEIIDLLPDDEPDLCPRGSMPLDWGLFHKVSLEKALIEMGLGFMAYLVLIILIGLVALPVLALGILAGIALWLLED